MRVVYVARNDGTDMRVSKECNSLLRAGYDVAYVGWRDPDTPEWKDPMPGVRKYFYLSPRSSPAQKALHFPAFLTFAIATIRRIKPDVVHCVNEELGLLGVLAQRFIGCKSVCDVFDSIELVWGYKRFPINSIARAVTRFVQSSADALIVTDERRRARLGRYSEKARVVNNYPEDVGAPLAHQLPNAQSRIRLYVAGTLTAARGLSSVMQLLDARSDIEVVSAGWLYDQVAKEFVEHPAVQYLGVLTPAESLRVAASCHAILALYEPTSENQLLASPNKVYDALCIGRPVIINKEVEISRWVSEHQTGYLVRYNDLSDLSRAVDRLRLDSMDMRALSWRLRELYEKGYSWNVAERELLATYANLS